MCIVYLFHFNFLLCIRVLELFQSYFSAHANAYSEIITECEATSFVNIITFKHMTVIISIQ